MSLLISGEILPQDSTPYKPEVKRYIQFLKNGNGKLSEKELMNQPEVLEIISKMHEEEAQLVANLLQGFLETKEQINKMYNMTNDDEQLKVFAVETAKAIAAKGKE